MAKKKRFYVSTNLTDPQQVEKFMEGIVQKLFGCSVEDVKRELGEDAWERHRVALLRTYAS